MCFFESWSYDIPTTYFHNAGKCYNGAGGVDVWYSAKNSCFTVMDMVRLNVTVPLANN